MKLIEIYKSLNDLGFNKNILADEGYNFHYIDVRDIEVTVSVLGDDDNNYINVCINYDGSTIPLTNCNSIKQIENLLELL